jgi:KDO2-lipid IV(A) lauroyltransferase
MKTLRYMAEAALLWASFFVFRMMGADTASSVGGWIGRTVGPRLAASRKAVTNLQNAFPDTSLKEAHDITTDMWKNLGQIIAEYPHLKDIILNKCEVVGEEHLHAIGKDNPCIIIGAHIANWELLPFYFNYKIDWPVSGIYRAPNNPFVEKLLDQCRNPENRGNYIAKSHKGAREIVGTLRKGERLAVLIDQKYNQGIPVEFFGRPAMTSPSFAQLAGRYDCPILPFQVERLDGCNFRLTIHPPFRAEGRNDEDVLLKAHALLEDWIAQKPGQWLWLHRRWDSKALKD